MKNRLELKLKKLLSGKHYGNFKSFFKGEGLEIQDFRQYQQGDDTRSINWKLSAKSGKFFVNLFRQEKDVDLHVFFDINYNWLGGVDRKVEYVVYDYIIDLAIFCKKFSGKFKGIYYEKNKRKYFEINKEQVKAYKLIYQMQKTINKLPARYKTNLGEFLKYEKKISKKHIIIIFSDLLGMTDYQIRLLKVLGINNEVFLFKIPVAKSIGINYNIFNSTINYNNSLKQLKIYDIYL